MELKGRYNRSQEHLASGFPVSGDHWVQDIDSVMGKVENRWGEMTGLN